MDQLSNFQTWLDGLNPDVVAGYAMVAVGALWALGALVMVLAKTDPAREPLGVRHDRLDREARAATRPVHSGRKASRTAVTR